MTAIHELQNMEAYLERYCPAITWEVNNEVWHNPYQLSDSVTIDKNLQTLYISSVPMGVLVTQRHSSTAVSSERIVGELLQTILEEAKEEEFEQGMRSRFSERFTRVFAQYRDNAVEAFTRLYLGGNFNEIVIAEAFRWLGRIQDSETHLARRNLLEKGLKHPFVDVREGALTGLALLDDPDASYAIREALEIERIPDMRVDMTAILDRFLTMLEHDNGGVHFTQM